MQGFDSTRDASEPGHRGGDPGRRLRPAGRRPGAPCADPDRRGGAVWLISYFTPFKLISFQAAQEAVDLNVILLLFAMMALVGVLKTTNVFPWAVDRLLERSRGNPSRRGAADHLVHRRRCRRSSTTSRP
jgi:hypothetical protein